MCDLTSEGGAGPINLKTSFNFKINMFPHTANAPAPHTSYLLCTFLRTECSSRSERCAFSCHVLLHHMLAEQLAGAGVAMWYVSGAELEGLELASGTPGMGRNKPW